MNINHDLLGDIATWVGALGTNAAFIVAFLQIRRERVERRRRDWREQLERRRVHADAVSGWRESDRAVISNRSHHPIHNVELVLLDGSVVKVEHAAPGRTEVLVDDGEPGRLSKVDFTDVRGDRWSHEPGHAAQLL